MAVLDKVHQKGHVRTARLLATSIVAIAFLASCGRSDLDRAKEQFIQANDRICTEVARKTLPALRETFPVPNGLPDIAAARRTGPGFVAAYRDALMQRETLVAPEPDRAPLRRHWMEYAKALDDLAAVHGQIGDDTTPIQYRSWLDPVSKEFYALNRFEKNYGFKVCGSERGPNHG